MREVRAGFREAQHSEEGHRLNRNHGKAIRAALDYNAALASTPGREPGTPPSDEQLAASQEGFEARLKYHKAANDIGVRLLTKAHGTQNIH